MSGFVRLLLSLRTPQPSLQLQRRNEPSQLSQPSPSPWVIEPLNPVQRRGLIAVSTLAIVSLLATFSLLSFLTYRLIFWRRYYRRYIGYNQYFVLIYNLAIADFQQGIGFIVSLRWIATNSVHASDAACFIQGVMLQIGDPMSGMFVLAIAVYAFLHLILNYNISHRAFVAAVVGLWVFGVVMVISPIADVGRYVWLPAVAWCWIPVQYFSLRLWTHYFWIFAVQFTTVVLYAIMFIQLRRKIAECVALGGHNTQSLRRLNRVVGYMVLYPVIYTGLTLPLAIGRLAAMAGHPFSVSYFCVAGSLMTLSGVCDTVLYTLTRKNAVLDPVGSAATAGHVYPLSSGTKADQAEIDHPHWDNTSAVDGAPGPQNSGPNHESLPGITEIVHSTEHRVSLEEILDTAHDPSSQPVVESGSSSGDPRGANREFV